MAHQNATTKVAAEISARSGGTLYIGIEARRALGVGYNDKIKVEIPSLGRVIEGALNSAGHITVPREIVREAFDEDVTGQGSTTHINGFVKAMNGTWDDDHELTEERHEKVYHLDSKNLQ